MGGSSVDESPPQAKKGGQAKRRGARPLGPPHATGLVFSHTKYNQTTVEAVHGMTIFEGELRLSTGWLFLKGILVVESTQLIPN